MLKPELFPNTKRPCSTMGNEQLAGCGKTPILVIPRSPGPAGNTRNLLFLGLFVKSRSLASLGMTETALFPQSARTESRKRGAEPLCSSSRSTDLASPVETYAMAATEEHRQTR